MFFVNMIIVGGIFLRVLSCFRVWLWPCAVGVVRGGVGPPLCGALRIMT